MTIPNPSKDCILCNVLHVMASSGMARKGGKRDAFVLAMGYVSGAFAGAVGGYERALVGRFCDGHRPFVAEVARDLAPLHDMILSYLLQGKKRFDS
jgi:hypothetical protein